MKKYLYILGIVFSEIILLLTALKATADADLRADAHVRNFTEWVQSQPSTTADVAGVLSVIHRAEFLLKSLGWFSIVTSLVVIFLSINLAFKLRDMPPKPSS